MIRKTTVPVALNPGLMRRPALVAALAQLYNEGVDLTEPMETFDDAVERLIKLAAEDRP